MELDYVYLFYGTGQFLFIYLSDFTGTEANVHVLGIPPKT